MPNKPDEKSDAKPGRLSRRELFVKARRGGGGVVAARWWGAAAAGPASPPGAGDVDWGGHCRLHGCGCARLRVRW